MWSVPLSAIVIAAVIGVNLVLIFLLLAAPLGRRRLVASVSIDAGMERVWNAVWPLGPDAGWSGEFVSTEPVGENRARVRLSHEGRDGRPIERTVRLEAVRPGEGFCLRVESDSALDDAFWRNFRERIELSERDGVTRLSLTQSDRYRGLAFLAFRYFRLRRHARGLKRWAETGRKPVGGLFEHPVTQFGFAVLSTFLLWPFFGLTVQGFVLSSCLTLTVALHELGHLAAFRLMGHKKVRMIFVPILGGIAIGGRPYDSRFEVAFVALMGAGFSAFLVPVAVLASTVAGAAGSYYAAALLAVLAAFIAFFNLANLIPVWRFDGGQVLRQICGGKFSLALAAFTVLGAFLLLGLVAGFDPGVILVVGAVFAVLSLLTAGGAVRPRHALKPVGRFDALALGAALVATFVIHASALLWAWDEYRRYRNGREPVVAVISVADRDTLAARVGAADQRAVLGEGNAVQT